MPYTFDSHSDYIKTCGTERFSKPANIQKFIQDESFVTSWITTLAVLFAIFGDSSHSQHFAVTAPAGSKTHWQSACKCRVRHPFIFPGDVCLGYEGAALMNLLLVCYEGHSFTVDTRDRTTGSENAVYAGGYSNRSQG